MYMRIYLVLGNKITMRYYYEREKHSLILSHTIITQLYSNNITLHIYYILITEFFNIILNHTKDNIYIIEVCNPT